MQILEKIRSLRTSQAAKAGKKLEAMITRAVSENLTDAEVAEMIRLAADAGMTDAALQKTLADRARAIEIRKQLGPLPALQAAREAARKAYTDFTAQNLEVARQRHLKEMELHEAFRNASVAARALEALAEELKQLTAPPAASPAGPAQLSDDEKLAILQKQAGAEYEAQQRQRQARKMSVDQRRAAFAEHQEIENRALDGARKAAEVANAHLRSQWEREAASRPAAIAIEK